VPNTFTPVAPIRVPLPPTGDDFLHELKWDGWRGVAVVGTGAPRLYGKQQRHLSRFDALATEICSALSGRAAVLDGEIVCLGGDGRPDFAALMARRGVPVYAAFDLLALDGRDLRSVPLLERKRWLEKVLGVSRTVRYVSHVRGSGREFFAATCRLDLEGIVSKPLASTYVCDPSPWRKVLNPRYSQKTDTRFELFHSRQTA
jgi:bifunctional non-homologous end joining protein LigD